MSKFKFSCSILARIILIIPLNSWDHFLIVEYIFFPFHHLFHLTDLLLFHINVIDFLPEIYTDTFSCNFF